MQDRPDAHELLGQLAAWLATDLIEHVPREQRFGVRVAANVAAICAREVAPGAPSAAEEAARMTRLLELAGEDAGGETDARELQRRAAAAIRAGKLDGQAGAARELLRDAVRAKLEVARPGYATFEDEPFA
jgi:uncharacterized protein DUF6285